ncbi:hypothetical protein AVEN_79760-1, partial [Araneus ventricosus]
MALKNWSGKASEENERGLISWGFITEEPHLVMLPSDEDE